MKRLDNKTRRKCNRAVYRTKGSANKLRSIIGSYRFHSGRNNVDPFWSDMP